MSQPSGNPKPVLGPHYAKQPLYKFMGVSALLHLSLLALSTLLVAVPGKNAAVPIKVNLAYMDIPKQEDMPEGRIEDLPMPPKVDKPAKADILSKYDSKAHSPEKGDKLKARKTAIPREEKEIPAPSLTRAKQDLTETRKEKPKTQVAAITKPRLDFGRKDSVKDVNLFSEEAIRKALETDKARRFEKDAQPREEQRRQLSAKMTDQPTPSADATRLSGVKGFKGAEAAKFASSSTGDVIEMGDEAIVSLNTSSFKYIDYFTSIKKAVELVWAYPEEAIIHGMSGAAVVKFTLNSAGELEDVRLMRTSGHKILDDEAQLAVKVAGPYNPFPKTLNKKRLHIVGTFIYQPTFNNVR
ncbi:MAG: energy transducer TonB [Nitrospinae bacterium]|nr:energy transducer TonB [Nitrospinota bacterium]